MNAQFTADVSSWLEAQAGKTRAALEELNGGAFTIDPWQRDDFGHGVSQISNDGLVLEGGGVSFSHVHGNQLPQAALDRHQNATKFQAMGVSLVLHPKNPHVPAVHMNMRYLHAETSTGDDVWWFGGGYDLTPVFPIEEDCRHFHSVAKDAVESVAPGQFSHMKHACDQYFYLPHRQEARGVGGIFFDDWKLSSPHETFEAVKVLYNSFHDAWLPIARRRANTPFTDRQRAFQLHRRGRYVEFNLLQDRGTKFGLQARGRTDAILMSLPPLVTWQYNGHEYFAEETAALKASLVPQDWS